MESTQIELEQNSAYQGINTFPSSLTREDMEPSMSGIWNSVITV